MCVLNYNVCKLSKIMNSLLYLKPNVIIFLSHLNCHTLIVKRFIHYMPL